MAGQLDRVDRRSDRKVRSLGEKQAFCDQVDGDELDAFFEDILKQ